MDETPLLHVGGDDGPQPTATTTAADPEGGGRCVLRTPIRRAPNGEEARLARKIWWLFVAFMLVTFVALVTTIWVELNVSFSAEGSDSLGLVLIAGLCFVFGYMLDVAHEWYSENVGLDAVEKEREDTEMNMMKAKVQADDLEGYLQYMQPIVLESAETSWTARVAAGNSTVQTESDAKHEFMLKRAATNLTDTQTGRNILTQCQLEKEYGTNSTEYKLFMIFSHWLYNWWIHIVVLTHICLAFFEERPFHTHGTPGFSIELEFDTVTAVIEAFLIVCEIFDVSIRLRLAYKWSVSNVLVNQKKRKICTAVHGFFVFWVAMDWFITLFTSMAAEDNIGISLEYILPIRPCILIMINTKVLDNFIIFCKAVVAAKDVFIMYILFIFVCGAISSVQYHHVWQGPENDVVAYKNRFANFLSSITALFVFISTNENYSDIVYPGVASQPWTVLWILFMVIVGSMIVVAMFTGVFEDAFNDEQVEQQKTYRLYERTGIISAFLLIDRDGSGSISKSEFQHFIKASRPGVAIDDTSLFNKLDADQGSELDLLEFVCGVEKLSVHALFVPIKRVDKAPWKKWAETRIVGTKLFQKVSTLITIGQLWVAALYNMVPADGSDDSLNDTLDIILSIALLYNVLEVCARIVIYGLDYFWNTSRYKEESVIDEVLNRFDLLVTVLAFGGACSGWAKAGGFVLGAELHAYRPFLVVTTLRIFVVLKSMRLFLFTLEKSLTAFTCLLVLLFSVVFIYGVVGVTLFQGLFTEWEGGLDYEASFDDLPWAFLTLFQCFVGEAFHELLYAASNAVSADVAAPGYPEWHYVGAATIYFVSFVIIVTTFFGSVFFGLILSVFGELYRRVKESGRTSLTYEDLIDARHLEEDEEE